MLGVMVAFSSSPVSSLLSLTLIGASLLGACGGKAVMDGFGSGGSGAGGTGGGTTTSTTHTPTPTTITTGTGGQGGSTPAPDWSVTVPERIAET